MHSQTSDTNIKVTRTHTRTKVHNNLKAECSGWCTSSDQTVSAVDIMGRRVHVGAVKVRWSKMHNHDNQSTYLQHFLPSTTFSPPPPFFSLRKKEKKKKGDHLMVRLLPTVHARKSTCQSQKCYLRDKVHMRVIVALDVIIIGFSSAPIQ